MMFWSRCLLLFLFIEYTASLATDVNDLLNSVTCTSNGGGKLYCSYNMTTGNNYFFTYQRIFCNSPCSIIPEHSYLPVKKGIEVKCRVCCIALRLQDKHSKLSACKNVNPRNLTVLRKRKQPKEPKEPEEPAEPEEQGITEAPKPAEPASLPTDVGDLLNSATCTSNGGGKLYCSYNMTTGNNYFFTYQRIFCNSPCSIIPEQSYLPVKKGIEVKCRVCCIALRLQDKHSKLSACKNVNPRNLTVLRKRKQSKEPKEPEEPAEPEEQGVNEKPKPGEPHDPEVTEEPENPGDLDKPKEATDEGLSPNYVLRTIIVMTSLLPFVVIIGVYRLGKACCDKDLIILPKYKHMGLSNIDIDSVHSFNNTHGGHWRTDHGNWTDTHMNGIASQPDPPRDNIDNSGNTFRNAGFLCDASRNHIIPHFLSTANSPMDGFGDKEEDDAEKNDIAVDDDDDDDDDDDEEVEDEDDDDDDDCLSDDSDVSLYRRVPVDHKEEIDHTSGDARYSTSDLSHGSSETQLSMISSSSYTMMAAPCIYPSEEEFDLKLETVEDKENHEEHSNIANAVDNTHSKLAKHSPLILTSSNAATEVLTNC